MVYRLQKRNAIIVDIDGTLAHSSGKRGWYDYDKVHADDVDVIVKSIITRLSDDAAILIVSGREDNCKDITNKWFETKI
jgi:uncharacterized HAD superfamily protein